MTINTTQNDTTQEFDRLVTLPDRPGNRVEVIEEESAQAYGLYLGNVFGPLWVHTQSHGGRAVLKVAFRNPDDDQNHLVPDIAYTCRPDALVEASSAGRPADLVVEIKLPTQSLRRLRDKARYFLTRRTQMIWLVIPELRLVEVYTAEDEWIVAGKGTLKAETLLPGFALSVASIFTDSAMEWP
jgi:Uma2 family endonuclease